MPSGAIGSSSHSSMRGERLGSIAPCLTRPPLQPQSRGYDGRGFCGWNGFQEGQLQTTRDHGAASADSATEGEKAMSL
jgi:hypothetical protein